MAKRREERYTFLEPGDMPRAKASLVFAAGSLGMLLLCFLLAYLFQGKAPLFLGAAGLVGALCAVYAFILGLIALAKKESRQRQRIVATLCSGVMVIVWLTVFLNGLQ